jgi:hypothetical protein
MPVGFANTLLSVTVVTVTASNFPDAPGAAPHELDPPVSPSTQPREAVPEGYVSRSTALTDLDGWQVRQIHNRDGRVLDGMIECDSHEGPGDRNLWTTRSFAEFELFVDWRITQTPV